MSLTASISTDLEHALVNHLWQSTAVVLLIWTLTLILKGNRASLRYHLWLLASLKFLVPLSLLVALGKALRPAMPQTSNTSVPQMSEVIVRAMEPYRTPLQSIPTAAVARTPTLHIETMVWLVCLCLWGFGTLVMLGLWLRAWLGFYHVARRGQRLENVAGVPVLICKDAIDPGVFGILKPVILLPKALIHEFQKSELDTIFTHELFHIRRRDNLTLALHTLIHAVFWFHPALWLIRARLLDERERACDELVLASGVDSETYARSILSVCKLHIEAPNGIMAGVTGGDLKNRIQRIVSGFSVGALTTWKKTILAATAIVVAGLPVSFGVMDTRGAYAQSESTSMKLPASQSETQSQTMDALAFDVASVRPSRDSQPSSNVPLGPGNVYTQTHGILSAKNQPLLTYLVFAYKLADYQEDAIKSTAPDWIRSDRYSIEARTEKRDVTKDELRLMMRTLLAERFRLAVHYEMKQVRIFALVRVKPASLGSKLRPHPTGTACVGDSLKVTAADGKSVELPLQPERGGFPAVCNGILGLPGSDQDRYSFGAADVPMSLIARALSSWGNLGRPVVDQTGLAGTYDFVMDYTPDPRPSYATIDSGGPSFQEALNEQLGLKLESGRAPVAFLVLDHAERPDAN